MTRVVIALLFLAGCTSQMKYSNVVRIRNVCSSNINVFIPEWICPYISRHLLSLNPLQARCRRYSRGER
ncbi:hypothetical protein APX81_26030 [Escherichia coli]|nr:hypothetical protein APU33_24955 [Escherichia coli]PAZ28256.1 hypothetical protein APU34_24510 [Escherichia coli]PAZ33366.1 hypothetical protein APU35_24190 [Escherichia coli]PAZ33989.1 hypothetical protein APU36_27700 [Escherichia coli]PAZ43421.1 hypothetical protein APX81_26030 [Escherichia coli]